MFSPYNICLNAWEMFLFTLYQYSNKKNHYFYILPSTDVYLFLQYLTPFVLCLCASLYPMSSLLSLCFLSRIITISIVTISNYFWFQSWSLMPLPSETMNDYTCSGYSDAFLHIHLGRTVSSQEWSLLSYTYGSLCHGWCLQHSPLFIPDLLLSLPEEFLLHLALFAERNSKERPPILF